MRWISVAARIVISAVALFVCALISAALFDVIDSILFTGLLFAALGAASTVLIWRPDLAGIGLGEGDDPFHDQWSHKPEV